MRVDEWFVCEPLGISRRDARKFWKFITLNHYFEAERWGVVSYSSSIHVSWIQLLKAGFSAPKDKVISSTLRRIGNSSSCGLHTRHKHPSFLK